MNKDKKRALECAGRLAALVRLLTGGRDFTTGKDISPASLSQAAELVGNLRKAVDDYDDAMITWSRGSK